MSSQGSVPRALGGTALAIVATVVGAAAAGLLPLSGLVRDDGGFVTSESWEDGEGHLLIISAVFCVLVWLVLLGLALTMCLDEKLWREAWQTLLAVCVGVLSVVMVASAFGVALEAISVSGALSAA